MEKEMNENEILRQLHEQYAINNNNSLSTVITLITALLASFAGYGYIYINSSNLFYTDFKACIKLKSECHGIYCLDYVFYTAIAVTFILSIIACICIYQGTAQRREQFIIHAIREKYKAYFDSIFPNKYHPYGKGKLDMLQGLYGEIIILLIASFAFIIFSLIIKIGYNIFPCPCSKDISQNGLWVLMLFIMSISIIIYQTIRYYNRQRRNYLKVQDEFIEKSTTKIDENHQKIIEKKAKQNSSTICNCWIVGSVLACIIIFSIILKFFY